MTTPPPLPIDGILRHDPELERRLRFDAEILASIVACSEDAIISKNLDGVITTWNKGAEHIFGFTAEEAIGQHITIIIPPDRQGEEFDILARVRRGERVDHFDTVRLRKDGTPLDISVTISPLRDPTGKVIGASKVARDITANKRAEQALRESEENLRQLAETLDGEVRSRTKELEERNADVLKQAEQLRDLSWRLLRTQDEERRRIARDLHDSAGQLLAVLGMNVSTLVESAKEKAPEMARTAEEILAMVQQLTQEIRTTSYLLHPPLLDEIGLPAALSWYVQGLAERSGMEIACDIAPKFGRLPSAMEVAIFRLVQECLTNIHRHASSKSASIRITRQPERVLVEVSDQGKGIPPEKLSEIQSKGSGVGIRGMRERLRPFGGDMVIDSNNAGTRILITVPAPDEASAPPAAETTFEAAV